MQSAKKVTLIPPKSDIQQIGGSFDDAKAQGIISSEVVPKEEKTKTKIYDKIHRFIKIILKLARSIGYDSDLKIKLNNGKYLEKSNIVDLLTHAMSVGKVLYGENEFIELLANSGVDPELIINDNVRIKLISFLNKKSKSEVQQQSINRKRKRTIENEEDIDKILKKRKNSDVQINSQSDLENDHEMEPEPISKFKKRKYIEEDSIDDDQINSEHWSIPEDD